jgi:hypothetical protein
MLPRAAIAFGAVHAARGGFNRRRDAECQNEGAAAAAVAGAVAAVAVGAAGLGLYAWSEQRRERDVVAVVRLSLGGTTAQAVATTFATRVKDGRVRSSATTIKAAAVLALPPTPTTTSAAAVVAVGGGAAVGDVSHDAAAWAAAVAAAMQGQRSSGVACGRTLVVAPPNVVARLGKTELGKLAGLVERTLPGGEVRRRMFGGGRDVSRGVAVIVESCGEYRGEPCHVWLHGPNVI